MKTTSFVLVVVAAAALIFNKHFQSQADCMEAVFVLLCVSILIQVYGFFMEVEK